MIRAEFVPIESRAFVEIESGSVFQVADVVDFCSGVGEGWMWGPPVEGAIVKLRYTATAEQAKRIDHRKLRDALYAAGAHKVYSIEANVERETRARVEGVDENLAEAAALDLYIEAHFIDVAMAERMRERTGRYLQEVGS